MGNCLDTCFPGKPDDQRTRPYVQMRQQQTWVKTGIVGLRDQGLKELPAALAEAGAALKVIDASNNRLAQLPDFIGGLSSLQRLVLAGNVLVTALPPGACAGLTSLKILVLDDNMLTRLPDDLGQLRRLERLSVRGNRLEALPDSIGELEALQALVVSRNLLETLPATLASCGRLEELDAQGNQLAALPSQLGQLKRLKTLQLDNNRIVGVPSEVLYGCVALQTLSLHGCPIKPDDLQDTPGFKEFEERRKSKYDKLLPGPGPTHQRATTSYMSPPVAPVASAGQHPGPRGRGAAGQPGHGRGGGQGGVAATAMSERG